jgi:hypothetical protein
MGGLVSGWSASDAARARGNASLKNAQVSFWQSADAQVRGDQAAGEMKLRGGQIAASGSAAAGHGQIDSQTGSAADVREKTAGMTALDVEKIKNNALRAAFGFKTQGDNYLADANAQFKSSSMAALGGAISGFTSMVSLGAAAGPGSGVAPGGDAGYEAMPGVGSQPIPGDGAGPLNQNMENPY